MVLGIHGFCLGCCLGRHVIGVVACSHHPVPGGEALRVGELGRHRHSVRLGEVEFVVAAGAAFRGGHDGLDDFHAVLVCEVKAVRAFLLGQHGVHHQRVVGGVNPEVAGAVVAVAHAPDDFQGRCLGLGFREGSLLLHFVIGIQDRDSGLHL